MVLMYLDTNDHGLDRFWPIIDPESHFPCKKKVLNFGTKEALSYKDIYLNLYYYEECNRAQF